MNLRLPLYPGGKNLHPNYRIASGLFLNIVIGFFTSQPHSYGGEALKGLLAVVLPCCAVITLAPVVVLGNRLHRLIAIGLLFGPMFLLGCGILGALLGANHGAG